MRGWSRSDYAFFAGKMPFQRHLESQRSRETKREWPLLDAVTEQDIDELQQKVRGEIECFIHEHFLQPHELSSVVKQLRKGRKLRSGEYYDVLEEELKRPCMAAMTAVMEGKFPTMREALLARLRELGIGVSECSL